MLELLLHGFSGITTGVMSIVTAVITHFRITRIPPNAKPFSSAAHVNVLLHVCTLYLSVHSSVMG